MPFLAAIASELERPSMSWWWNGTARFRQWWEVVGYAMCNAIHRLS